MARQDDISALLAKAEQQLKEIQNEYNASLHEQTIPGHLKVTIKNYCENLRSVLEYLAHDIREKHCPNANPKDRFYFPILPDLKQFSSQMNQWFPDLKNNAPKLWAQFEQFQPYQQGQEWLGHFNKVNNENKHEALVAQTRQVQTSVRADIKGGGSVLWTQENVRFKGKVFIGGVPVDPSTQMPVSDPRLNVTKTEWVDFRFDEIGVSAIVLLRQVLQGVKGINETIKPHIQ